MEELELGEMEYESAEEFLASIKKKFSKGEEEAVKVAELRKLEQGGCNGLKLELKLQLRQRLEKG